MIETKVMDETIKNLHEALKKPTEDGPVMYSNDLQLFLKVVTARMMVSMANKRKKKKVDKKLAEYADTIINGLADNLKSENGAGKIGFEQPGVVEAFAEAMTLRAQVELFSKSKTGIPLRPVLPFIIRVIEKRIDY